MQNIFILGLKDFLSKKFLAITLLPFIITFALFAMLYSFVDVSFIIGNFTQIEWINKIVEILVEILGWIAVIALSTIVATVVMGFFTPYVIKEIQKRHYPDIAIEGGISLLDYFVLLGKSFIKFIGLFFISALFYLIPLFNYIAFHIPFYYLFSNLTSLDVGGEIMKKDELEEAFKKYKIKIYSTTFILYLITLIPFAGMFLQVYFVSVMAHLFFRIKAKKSL